MHMYSRLTLTLLLAPGLIQAQAPTFSQRLKAGRPQVEGLMNAFEFRQALALAQGLLPDAKPAFDKSTVRAIHTSVWNFIEAGQAYSLAFRAAAAAGQWEKSLEYLGKALEIARESQAAGQAPLTELMNDWQRKADAAKALLESNAEAVKELKAKARTEDYEQESVERIKVWEKDLAEGTKNAGFFKYDLEMSARDVAGYENFKARMEAQIKSQQGEIEAYKPHPGDRKHWVEAVIANHATLDALPDRGDRIERLCRLSVLDPENKKVEHELEVQQGKAAPDKAPDKMRASTKAKKG